MLPTTQTRQSRRKSTLTHIISSSKFTNSKKIWIQTTSNIQFPRKGFQYTPFGIYVRITSFAGSTQRNFTSIFRNREFKVLVGTDKVDEGGKLYDVEKIIIHEKYSNVTEDYDICILKLNESLTFGPKVNKVALTGNIVKLKKGLSLNATGWGYTQVRLKLEK